MNKIFGTVLAAALTLTVSAASAEQLSEHRGIDARVVKVKLGGVIDLRVKQGATASLVLIGEKRDVARVSVVQNGDTLIFDTENRGWNLGNDRQDVRAELTLPNLNEVVSHGVGATDIKGFSGNELRLTLDGAGSVNLTSQYRNVAARHSRRRGQPGCAPAAGRCRRPRHVGHGRRHRVCQDHRQPETERPGFGHRIWQAGQPQRRGARAGQRQLAVIVVPPSKAAFGRPFFMPQQFSV